MRLPYSYAVHKPRELTEQLRQIMLLVAWGDDVLDACEGNEDLERISKVAWWSIVMIVLQYCGLCIVECLTEISG